MRLFKSEYYVIVKLSGLLLSHHQEYVIPSELYSSLKMKRKSGKKS